MATFSQGTQIAMQTVVNVRRTPGTSGKPDDDVIAEIPLGQEGTVIKGPRQADGMSWWQIRSQLHGKLVVGWAAQALPSGEVLFAPRIKGGGAFRTGDRIFLRTTIRLRRTPGLQNKPADDIVAVMPMEMQVTVVAGPELADGLTWWQVRSDFSGQTVLGWLNQASFTGEALVEKVPGSAVSIPDAGGPDASGRFRRGQQLFTTTFVNLRQSPGYVGKTPDDILAEMPYGAHAQVSDGPRSADELIWWRVVYAQADGHSVEGWTAEATADGIDLLSDVAPPPPPPVEPPTLSTYTPGDTVINLSNAAVNVRRTPGYVGKQTDDIVISVPTGQSMTVTDGPQKKDGLYWWQVAGTISGRGFSGWMADVSPSGTRLMAPAIFKDRVQVGLPYQGSFVISQLWGENPGFYQQFTYDGVALRGHNGIDFALPVGTALTAVASGRVKTVGASPAGFGLWVMLSHAWGESVYAHMNRVNVTEGQTLSAGAMLGESGNSGTSTGPHLHFAIRITPFFRGDGWGGYCDPLPFMNASQLTMPGGSRDLAGMTAPTPAPAEAPGRRLP